MPIFSDERIPKPIVIVSEDHVNSIVQHQYMEQLICNGAGGIWKAAATKKGERIQKLDLSRLGEAFESVERVDGVPVVPKGGTVPQLAFMCREGDENKTIRYLALTDSGSVRVLQFRDPTSISADLGQPVLTHILRYLGYAERIFGTRMHYRLTGKEVETVTENGDSTRKKKKRKTTCARDQLVERSRQIQEREQLFALRLKKEDDGLEKLERVFPTKATDILRSGLGVSYSPPRPEIVDDLTEVRGNKVLPNIEMVNFCDDPPQKNSERLVYDPGRRMDTECLDRTLFLKVGMTVSCQPLFCLA